MKIGDTVRQKRSRKAVPSPTGIILEFGHYPGKQWTKGVYQMDGDVMVLWSNGSIEPYQLLSLVPAK